MPQNHTASKGCKGDTIKIGVGDEGATLLETRPLGLLPIADSAQLSHIGGNDVLEQGNATLRHLECPRHRILRIYHIPHRKKERTRKPHPSQQKMICVSLLLIQCPAQWNFRQSDYQNCIAPLHAVLCIINKHTLPKGVQHPEFHTCYIKGLGHSL